MIKKRLRSLLIPVLLTFCSYALFGQDSLRASKCVVDSVTGRMSYQRHYLSPEALIMPTTLLVYGGLKPLISAIPRLDINIMNQVQQHHPGFRTHAADYLMWAPSASLYVMDAMNVKSAHNFREHLILDAASVVITGGLGYGMRIISRNMKVYTTEGTKFPSGHTANAFRGAEILRQELKENNKILSYSGYFIATGVGVLRIYDKAHLLSEVLAGAGLGILSAKLTYWLFDEVKYKSR